MLSEVGTALGISARGVVRVRMRNPFRPSGGRLGALLELRPSVPSALTRAPLGALGMAGAKWPLAVMDYAGNGFDSRPLAESLSGRRGCVAVCDGLAAFAYLGWRRPPGGPAVIYLSHDYEPHFAPDRYSAALARKRIDSALKAADLLVAATEADRSSYLAHGVMDEGKAVVYPNVFPPAELWRRRRPARREGPFTIAVVQTGWLGRKGALEDARRLASALRLLPPSARVAVESYGTELGAFLRVVLPSSVELRPSRRVPGRVAFLEALSGAQAGVNFGHWAGGANVKKFDFALAGLVVLSDGLGSRGGLLPHERVFEGPEGLAAAVDELAGINDDELSRMGRENSRSAEAASRAASDVLRSRVAALGGGGGQ